tara:strand:+ start:1638 stop:2261 length:624 start_codon:yes stop_codon:yes gene_type:complete
MKFLDINTWNRKQHFEHFRNFADPYFGVVVDVDVTNAYEYSKQTKTSFFVLYLHACLKAINSVENFRYRIQDDKVVIYDIIHASATISREDKTFGFSFIHYSEDFDIFYRNFQKEKERIMNSTDLFPSINTKDCIYCSALPWYNFSGHKEPVSGFSESVPMLAYGKYLIKEAKLMMPVSLISNHALVDGYHVGEFFKKFQIELNKIS